VVNCSRSAAEKNSSTILVIGDIMLNQYTMGTTDINETSSYLGGAANVAVNIANIGGQVTLAGVIGKDEDGEAIRRMLKQKDIPAVLGVDASRHTTVKERIGTPIGIFHDILKLVTVMLEDVNLVAIGDYGKGVVTEELMAAICEICKLRGIPVLVDPIGVDFDKYKGADLIKPNFSALEALYGREIESSKDWERASDAVFSITGCRACVVTCGSNGAVLIDSNGSRIHYTCSSKYNTPYTSVADDVFMAGLAFGVSKGLPLEDACKAANELASLVIGCKGTITVDLVDWNNTIRKIQSNTADFL
jgi:bifunctional ADP-heptose synthase (sugar kinase/adenylyltransferase)